MTTNRDKKIVRRRGSHTHGWGSMKKHRGAGNRGGRGLAGTGKRGDAKKPSVWKKVWFGKHGFVNATNKKIVVMNIQQLEQQLEQLVEKKVAVQEGEVFTIDLSKMGVHKLLGDGTITKKMKIKASFASQKATERIKKAGGEVILPVKTS